MRSAFRFALATAAILMATPAAQAETAVLAGGCFWCVEKDMDHITGVTKTTSGFGGGTSENPTYKSHDGYTEAVEVEFDEKVISYGDLVARFLRTIDVTDGEGQFCDRGASYVPAIFYMSPEQKSAAEKAVADAEKALGQKLAVPVLKHTRFGRAEDYHQDYYLGENRVLTRFGWIKQSDAYANYRKACGRDARVKQVWGKQAYTDGVDGGS
jgi:peptide-methionine (S)-S-oxide reductase